MNTAEIRVEAARHDAERMQLILPRAQELVAPTYGVFGQLSSIVGAGLLPSAPLA